MLVDNLFSDDLKLRERSARKYKVFAENVHVPKEFFPDWKQLLGDRDWNDGLEWPDELVRRARKNRWPQYAFGTANAACLLVMYRPGLEPHVEKVEDLDRVLFIRPRFPVLGGIPHAHNALFPLNHLKSNDTWNNIHRYLKLAFEGLRNPWSQLMTCNIIPRPGHTGEVDTAGNAEGLKALDRIVRLCQPKLILLCGSHVHKATRSWARPQDTKIEQVAHPSVWQKPSGSYPNGEATAMIVRQSLFES